MKQRVVIAMALACKPELLLADEPTTALDVTIQAQILDMMQELKEKINTSIILITHDLGIVLRYATRWQSCTPEKSLSTARRKIYMKERTDILIQKDCLAPYRIWRWKAGAQSY